MKRRPRRIENRIAEELSKWFEKHGHDPVERIPVIGRRGPDISWNEVKLIVDAKSRIQVPDGFMISDVGIIQWANMIGVRIRDLDLLLSDEPVSSRKPGSVMVARWYNHMAQWDKMPYGGIPALVLHKPDMRVGNAVLVIRELDRRKLNERMRNMRRVDSEVLRETVESPVAPIEGIEQGGDGSSEPVLEPQTEGDQ